MRTIETDRAIVEIIAWPEDKPWQERYKTLSRIERGICTLVLSPEVFHDENKANMSYRRFIRKIEKEGLSAPNVVFRRMNSRASKNIFCILTTTQSVFNSACESGRLVVIESDIDEKRRLCAVRQEAAQRKEA